MMTPQERHLIDELFDRLAGLENSPRDPEAEKAILEGLRRAPNAAYALVQTALVQDEALKRANAHIEELEARTQPQQQAQSGSFLDSMRDTVFGQGQSRGSVPNVRPADPGAQRGPIWNSGQVLNSGPSGYADPRSAGYAGAPPSPGPAAGSGGGSFLGTAAAAAAGVVGGSLLMNSIRGLMGGNHQSFGDSGSLAGGLGSPWGSDQSGGNLARDAGLNDIGKNDRDSNDDSRQGLFDKASDDNNRSDDNDRNDDNDYANNNDDDDDGFGSDDDGGSDYA
jgi:uncharacterized protein